MRYRWRMCSTRLRALGMSPSSHSTMRSACRAGYSPYRSLRDSGRDDEVHVWDVYTGERYLVRESGVERVDPLD